MAKSVTGGCKCGAVSYRGEALEAQPFRCYCRDCQQLTGTGHSEMFPLDRDSFRINGQISEYSMTGSSGRKTFSCFCPDCGSPIYRRSERSDDRLYVHAASLSDPTLYAPGLEIYADSAQPWDQPKGTAES